MGLTVVPAPGVVEGLTEQRSHSEYGCTQQDQGPKSHSQSSLLGLLDPSPVLNSFGDTPVT